MHMDEADVFEKIGTWLRQLNHTDPARRLSAAACLGRMGARAEIAVPGLIKCLQDDHAHIRKMAALSLGDIGGPVGLVVSALLTALADSDAGVRRFAGLGRLGPKFSMPILRLQPHLLPGLASPMPLVREQVAAILGQEKAAAEPRECLRCRPQAGYTSPSCAAGTD